jgi:hypothetical protein
MPAKNKPAEEVIQPKEDTVVVSRKDLEAFMKRLESVESENKKLIAVADKGRMFHEEARLARESGAPLIHTCKLTRMGSDKGRLVIAWKMVDNESYVDGNRLVEKQNIEVFYQDGTSDVMRLIDFYRRQNKQTIAEIIKRSKNERTGEMEFEVELKDGERITIPVKFVN